MDELKKETKKTVNKIQQKTTPKKAGQKKKSTPKKASPMSRVMPAVKNAVTKTGRSIGHTFMEMSDSLAGWVDDTSRQIGKEIKKNKKQPAKKTVKKVTTKKTAK
jgi:hypothetical protein